jgi:hypothetical protein
MVGRRPRRTSRRLGLHAADPRLDPGGVASRVRQQQQLSTKHPRVSAQTLTGIGNGL